MKRTFYYCLLLLACVAVFFACQKERVAPYDPTAQAATDEALIKEFMAKDTTIKNPVRTGSGLYYVKRIAGNGKPVQRLSKVKVHYIGKFLNGQVFESSYTTNTPFPFTVGTNEVIKGWDEGVQLMEEGESARLYIPSGLAYGPVSAGNIPGNTCLVFEIKVLSVN